MNYLIETLTELPYLSNEARDRLAQIEGFSYESIRRTATEALLLYAARHGAHDYDKVLPLIEDYLANPGKRTISALADIGGIAWARWVFRLAKIEEEKEMLFLTLGICVYLKTGAPYAVLAEVILEAD